VTIHLDTSVLIEILTRTRPLLPAYEAAAAAGHRIGTSTIALYEWLRGPRVDLELDYRRRLFPDEALVAFGPMEAARAAKVYGAVRRGRGREFDIAIAACAMEHRAALWTTNANDFGDIPGLKLYEP
jgi:predicted nucleic acid-binding protein